MSYELADLNPNEKLPQKTDLKDMDDKFNLSKESFKNVLDSDIHFDNKANRTLSAMAFFTTASVAIFAFISNQNNTSSPNQAVLLGGLSWASISFIGYMISLLLGAVFYANALGPSLNIPTKTPENPEELKSRLFFALIGKVSKDEWENHWRTENSEKLKMYMTEDFIRETYLLAQKTATKYNFMKIGSFFFHLAFLFFVFLISNIFKDVNLTKICVCLTSTAFAIAHIYENTQRPSNRMKRQNIAVISVIWILSVFVGLSLNH